MSFSKKVFLVGGTGLIGQEVIPFLESEKLEIYALTIEDVSVKGDTVHWIKGDLFDQKQIDQIISEIKPDYLLNFAWCARDDYLTSDLNYKFRDAGFEMLKSFYEHGGKKAVYAGTCFEYDFKEEPLKETDSVNPKTIYAQCKNDLRIECEKYAQSVKKDFGWGRIFYVYGKNEAPNRLTAYIINSLKRNEVVEIRTSHLKKDYMYTKDIAGAFVKFLLSDICGIVNICTGQVISIGDFAQAIAKKMGKENLLLLKQEETNQPLCIVGDNQNLMSLDFKFQYTLEKALDEIILG